MAEEIRFGNFSLVEIFQMGKYIFFMFKVDEDADMVENGELEKLSPEPKTRDASTGMSQERLSLMIKYNQIGSLTSLPRGSKVSRPSNF